MGVGIRAEGFENFSKINKQGGGDYSVVESMAYFRFWKVIGHL